MLDRDLDRLVLTAAPALCALQGVGTDVAGAVVVAFTVSTRSLSPGETVTISAIFDGQYFTAGLTVTPS
jgi:hypothetical protein